MIELDSWDSVLYRMVMISCQDTVTGCSLKLTLTREVQYARECLNGYSLALFFLDAHKLLQYSYKPTILHMEKNFQLYYRVVHRKGWT